MNFAKKLVGGLGSAAKAAQEKAEELDEAYKISEKASEAAAAVSERASAAMESYGEAAAPEPEPEPDDVEQPISEATPPTSPRQTAPKQPEMVAITGLAAAGLSASKAAAEAKPPTRRAPPPRSASSQADPDMRREGRAAKPAAEPADAAKVWPTVELLVAEDGWDLCACDVADPKR